MAIRFDASADRILRTSDLLNYNAAFTWMAWVYISTDTNAQVSVMSLNNNNIASLDADIFGFDTDGTTAGTSVSVAAATTTQFSGAFSVGTWYHVTLVRTTTGNMDYYLNGVYVNSNTRSVAARGVASRMEVGAMTNLNAVRFDGRIAYQRAWSTDLSAAEIADEVQSPVAVRNTNIYGDWPHLSDATRYNDISGNNRVWSNVGTLTDEAEPTLTPATPYFVAAGTGAATATNGATISPGLPAGWAADDVHVMLVHRSDNNDITDPSGWTRITPSSAAENNTAAQRVELFLRRAVGGDTAPTVTAGTGTTIRLARIYGIRGVPNTGNVEDLIDVSVRGNNAAANTIEAPTVTTTADNTFALFLGAYEDDPTAGSTPSGWGPVGVFTSALGNDAALFHASRILPDPTNLGTTTTTVSGGTFANSVNVGIVLVFKSTAAVALTIPHLGSANTLAGVTLTPGAVALTLAHLASASTLTAPTITPAISIPHLASATTLPGVTITPGAVALTIPHLASATTRPGLTITPGAVALTVPHLASANTLTAPNITATTTLTIPHLASANTLTAPTVTPGAVAVSIPHLASATTQPGLTLAAGTATFAISHLASASTLTAPSITPGAVALTIAHLASATTRPGLTLSPGAVALTINHLASASQLFAPSIDPVLADTLLIPHLASATTLNAPTFVPGAATFSVPHLASANTLPGMTFDPGAVALSLAHLASANTLPGVTLASGTATMELAHLAGISAFYDPVIEPGVMAFTIDHLAGVSTFAGLTLRDSSALPIYGTVATVGYQTSITTVTSGDGARVSVAGSIAATTTVHGST